MRKRILLLVLLLLICCVVPIKTAIRAKASTRLEQCLGLNRAEHPSPSQRQKCLDESAEFCIGNGLEAACGVDDLWGKR